MIHKLLEFHKALGVIFLAMLIVGVWLVWATFTNQFADYEKVTLKTTSVGLQLPSRGDVKIRGVIVGEVLEMKATGEDQAELTLGIFPDELHSIPADVTGSIVPKTLFGEKYVSLEIPKGTTTDAPAIRAGAVIDQSTLGTEVEKVLNDVYPLLRAVQPADLNLTLTALSTALEGRGEELGENLATLDSYLKRMNPKIPALLEDLQLSAKVADQYADILPQVASILDDTVRTGHTLEGREEKLNRMLKDISSFADTAGQFLADNGDLIERFSDLTVQQMRVLAKYSPEFPCLTAGFVKADKLLSAAFRGYELHTLLMLLPNQPRKWDAGDRPVTRDTRGPTCTTLPNPPWNGYRFRTSIPNFDDGVERDTGVGTKRVAPGSDETDPAGYRGSPEDRDLLRTLLQKRYGATTATDLGVLLAGPLAVGGGDR